VYYYIHHALYIVGNSILVIKRAFINEVTLWISFVAERVKQNCILQNVIFILNKI
jgi:hypothetical protein